jgi:hypothetical protein
MTQVAHHHTTNGEGKIRPDGSCTPYCWTSKQRQYAMLLHSHPNGLTLDDMIDQLGARSWGRSSIRVKLKKCLDQGLIGAFCTLGQDDRYRLTGRATEICLNIVASTTSHVGG